MTSFFASSQITETFEVGQTANTTSFTSGVKIFNLTYDWVVQNYPNYGYKQSAWYVDNYGNCQTSSIVGGFSTDDGSEINVNHISLYVSQDCFTPPDSTTSIKIYWYKDGSEVSSKIYSFTNGINLRYNGFYSVDFDEDQQSCIYSDELRFEVLGSLNYIGMDQLIWSNTGLIQSDLNASIVSVNNTLSVTSDLGNNYQWLDCDDANSIISGETNEDFEATQSGYYSVEVSYGSCKDTSDCLSHTYVSSGGNQNQTSVETYPNPASNEINVSLPDGVSSAEIVISNSIGIISKVINTNLSITNIDISDLQSGFYLIRITSLNYAELLIIE